MTIDERLASYVRDRYDGIVADAAVLCADPDAAEALVVSALARLAAWPRRLPQQPDEIDALVRRRVCAVCIAHDRRSRRDRRDQLSDVHVMDVVSGGGRPQPAPAVRPDAGDPVAEVARRASRIRRWRLGCAVVVALAIVVGVGQVLTGGSGTVSPVTRAAAATPPLPLAAVPHAVTAHPSGVVTGDGALWTIELHANSGQGGTVVERRSLTTGRVQASYRVPGEDFGIGFGLGRVWTWGADSDEASSADVSALDPASATVRTVALGSGQVRGVAFAGGRAWFSQAARNRVVSLLPGLDIGMASYRANSAGDLAAYGPNDVVALTSGGALLELPSGAVLNHNDTSLTFISSSPSYGVWIGHGGTLTYSPAIDQPLTVTIKLPVTVAHVVGTPQTGVYVATTSTDPQRYDPYLAYYSPAALRAKHPKPTARLNGMVQVESMTAGQRGGVVFVTTDGAITRWN